MLTFSISASALGASSLKQELNNVHATAMQASFILLFIDDAILLKMTLGQQRYKKSGEMLRVSSFFCTDAGIERARRPRKSMQIARQWLSNYRTNPCTLPTKVAHIAQPHCRFAPTMLHNRRCNRQAHKTRTHGRGSA